MTDKVSTVPPLDHHRVTVNVIPMNQFAMFYPKPEQFIGTKDIIQKFLYSNGRVQLDISGLL